MPPEAAEGVDQVGVGRSYVLLRDDDGFSIWNLRDDSERPIAEFGPTDEDAELAWERFEHLNARASQARLRDGLVWLAAVIGAIWVTFTLVLAALSTLIILGVIEDAQGLFQRILGLPLLLLGLPAAFTVVVGMYAVLWLREHDRRS